MGALLNRRRYMGGGSSLPYDAEIEYLESTGTSGFYITSGVVRPSDFTSVEIQTTVQFLSTSGRQIHGATDSLYFGVNNGKWECDYRQYVGTADTEDIHVLSKKMSVSNSNYTQRVYLDGNLIYTRKSSYIANCWNVSIGVFNYSNSSTEGWHARIFNEKIYVNDVLVRDMAPIRFGQLGYLYDKVSGLSFGNSSTGTFTLGPDKT